MNGVDIGQTAQQALVYLGSPKGGYMAATAIVVTCILWYCGILSGRHAVEAFVAAALAWSVPYFLTTVIAWI